MKTFFPLLAVLVICLSSSYYNTKTVSSLSCPQSPHGPPCYEYGGAEVIFIGTAVEVTKIDWDGAPPVYWNRYKQVNARLSIEEAFKGIEGNEVSFEMFDCPYYFEEGKRYLVYSNRRPDGKLDQNDRYPTRLVSEAETDIQYIRALKGTQSLGTIQGYVSRNTNSFKPLLLIRDRKNYPQVPMPGIKIAIESPQHKFETITNDKGAFEFINVPAENYIMRPVITSNLAFVGVQRDVKVTGHGCFYAGFYVVPKGQVSGRILNAEGLPLSGRVSIFVADGVTDEMIEKINNDSIDPTSIHSLWVSKDGRYSFSNLPKGNYVVALNLINYPKNSEARPKPSPRMFYPGVPNFSQATIISLDEGEMKQNLDIKLPPETIP